MIIAPNDQDKVNIAKLIEGEEKLPRVQSMVYLERTIQIPSSYLRGSGMMKHIIATQQNANAILMILSADRPFPVYSPNFAKAFRIPTLGIVLVEGSECSIQGIEQCLRELEEAKVEMILTIDLTDNSQCQQLLQKINLIEEGMI
ncbi:EutP/PduV family microcompartment system protein [Streptococcus cameli]